MDKGKRALPNAVCSKEICSLVAIMLQELLHPLLRLQVSQECLHLVSARHLILCWTLNSARPVHTLNFNTCLLLSGGVVCSTGITGRKDRLSWWGRYLWVPASIPTSERSFFSAQKHSDQNHNASFLIMWLVEESKQGLASLKNALIAPHPGCSIRTREGTLELPFSPDSFPSIGWLALRNNLCHIATHVLPLGVAKDKRGGKRYSCGKKAVMTHCSCCRNYRFLLFSEKMSGPTTVPGSSPQHQNFPDAHSVPVHFCVWHLWDRACCFIY